MPDSKHKGQVRFPLDRVRRSILVLPEESPPLICFVDQRSSPEAALSKESVL